MKNMSEVAETGQGSGGIGVVAGVRPGFQDRGRVLGRISSVATCGEKARARQCFCPKKAARGIYEKVAGTPQGAGYLALSGQELVGQKNLVGQERPAGAGLSVE